MLVNVAKTYLAHCFEAGFITPRSAVRSRPPLPIKSTTYSGQQNWPLIVCGRIVADARASDSSGFNSSTLAMFGRMGITKCHLDGGMAHQLSDRRLRISSLP